MEYRFTRIIKTFIYISILISFISGIILLFLKFDDDKTLIELHSSKVIFPLFVPFNWYSMFVLQQKKKCF